MYIYIYIYEYFGCCVGACSRGFPGRLLGVVEQVQASRDGGDTRLFTCGFYDHFNNLLFRKSHALCVCVLSM